MCRHIVNCIHFFFNNNLERAQLQTAIDKLTEWSAENGLDLNSDKSDSSHIQDHHTVLISIIKERIAKRTDIRDVRVLFDSKLTYKSHVQTTVNERMFDPQK